MTDRTAIHAFVSGRVQGVNFRWETRATAHRLGLDGWVRNLADGRVETFAQGPVEAIAAFRGFLARGPRSAAVTAVEEVDAVPRPELHGFDVRF